VIWLLEDIIRCTVLLEHRAQVSWNQQIELPVLQGASLPIIRAEVSEHPAADGLHDDEGERLDPADVD